MSKFLQWWIVFLLQAAFMVGAWYFGLIDWVWLHDITKLSFAILGVWSLSSLHLGYLIWRDGRDNGESYDLYTVPEAASDKKSETAWFTSGQCLALGMLGTVIGFCIMVSGIPSNADFTNSLVLQGIIHTMVSGMSTAMVATGVGLLCSNLLKIQAFIFDRNG